MTETIIPGTYIEVSAEGLISAGGIATGVVAVIGTASDGPVLAPLTLGLPDDARANFGPPDDVRNAEDGENPLTLVRAAELCYANGASTVVAVRVAGPSARSAKLALKDANGATVATLTAARPGTWANGVPVQVAEAEDDCLIEHENVPSPFDELHYRPVVPSPLTRLRVTRGDRTSGTFAAVYRRVQKDEKVTPTAAGRYILSEQPVQPGMPAAQVTVTPATGQPRTYNGDAIEYDTNAAPDNGKVAITTATGELVFSAAETPTSTDTVTVTYGVGHADPSPGQVLITAWNGHLDFAAGEAPDQANGDQLDATYLVDRASCVSLSLASGATREQYIAPDAVQLSARINAGSNRVTAVADDVHGGGRPAAVQAALGDPGNTHGASGADAGNDEYGEGLAAIENMLINIVVLAGQHAQTSGALLAGHLAATEATDHERVGIIGTAGNTVEAMVAHNQATGRVVVVAPGISYPGPDGFDLPAGYTAAAVAGLVASTSVQTSLTNKPIVVPGLVANFNRGQQMQLVEGAVLALVLRSGTFRVLRGLTSEGAGAPFGMLTTRRIVDYARYGIRSAADPYIGRLNNPRVRDALKATLDGFLTQMVEDEALSAYELNVFADRAQELRGEVSVAILMKPQTSMEFILVKITLA